MRKIALLTASLLVLGVFSLSAEVTFTASGNSTLTAGWTIEDGAFGFTNASTADLKVTIVPSGSLASTAPDDTSGLYAQIELKDFKYEVTSAGGTPTAPTVSTKLFWGPMVITTFSAPTVSVDYVASADGGAVSTSYAGNGGFAWEYEDFLGIDGITVGNEILSDKSYAGDDNNTDLGFAGSVYVKTDVGDGGSVEFKVVRHVVDWAFVDAMGLGGKASLGTGDLTASLAFDANIAADFSSTDWDLGTGIVWTTTGDEGTSKVSPNLTLNLPSSGDATVNANLDYEGTYSGLVAKVSFGLDDITGTQSWDAAVDLSYANEGLKPFATVSMNSAGDAIPVTLGLEITTVDNLTSTLKYASTNLAGDDQNPGVITWENKIAF